MFEGEEIINLINKKVYNKVQHGVQYTVCSTRCAVHGVQYTVGYKHHRTRMFPRRTEDSSDGEGDELLGHVRGYRPDDEGTKTTTVGTDPGLVYGQSATDRR